jgi:hypothetical protein
MAPKAIQHSKSWHEQLSEAIEVATAYAKVRGSTVFTDRIIQNILFQPLRFCTKSKQELAHPYIRMLERKVLREILGPAERFGYA